ncbi:hypothetical protein CIHG_03541 [Coccidioides immitis H538.4]|uniref:Secreted protein n=3 Tax=Coccidioides immitis TaxID=5501 RepID=A0A0J8QWJ2_COCIT|nr:hypothetical protein CIRG_08889 [Coccidioides immitis RMSCC 2394]KMU75703.1 hypothetical protein CISG_04877 [Coccidioides immitis RMSCC 3703]KMU86011.1 hypothetical protein CIHG_03541 [Coccidioides immitis H538.4]
MTCDEFLFHRCFCYSLLLLVTRRFGYGLDALFDAVRSSLLPGLVRMVVPLLKEELARANCRAGTHLCFLIPSEKKVLFTIFMPSNVCPNCIDPSSSVYVLRFYLTFKE